MSYRIYVTNGRTFNGALKSTLLDEAVTKTQAVAIAISYLRKWPTWTFAIEGESKSGESYDATLDKANGLVVM